MCIFLHELSSVHPNEVPHSSLLSTQRYLDEIQGLYYEEKVRNGTFSLGLWCYMNKHSYLCNSLKIDWFSVLSLTLFWLMCFFVSGIKRD